MNRLVWFVGYVVVVMYSRRAMCVPSCGEVDDDLTPCLSFLQGEDATSACCAGFKELNNVAKTKADLTAICNCVKEKFSNVNYDPNRVPLLPKACGVDLNLPPIDKNTDCSKIFLHGFSGRIA